MIIKKFFLCILIFSCPAFSQDKKISLKDFEWLVGNWENITQKSQSFEIWEKINDSLMLGKSFEIKNSDTISFESIRLEVIDESIYYIPTVKNQNEGKPVKFKLMSLNGEAIFENEEHDFPQRIVYAKDSSGSLNAWIEGEINGKHKKIPYTFKRAN